MRNRFRRHYGFAVNGAKINPLSANFKYKDGMYFGSEAVATLDEALALVEHKSRSKAASAHRDKGVERPPPTRKQLFAMAKGQAAMGQRKVKMPALSIQQHEIEDA